MTYYGPWITPPLQTEDPGDRPSFAAGVTGDASGYASSAHPFAADDYDHPFGGGAGGGSGPAAALTSVGYYPTRVEPVDTVSWCNGQVANYYLDLHLWTPPLFTPPPLPPGAIGVELGPDVVDPLDHWLLHVETIASESTAAQRLVFESPGGPAGVVSQIDDPDPDGTMAALAWRFYLIDPAASLSVAESDTANAAVQAAYASMTQGFLSIRGAYTALLAAIAAGTHLGDVPGSTPHTSPVSFPVADQPGHLISLALAHSTVLDRPNTTPIPFPDWTASSVLTSTPDTVVRRFYRALPFVTPLAVYQPPNYRYIFPAKQEFDQVVATRAHVAFGPAVHIPRPGFTPPSDTSTPNDMFADARVLFGATGIASFNPTGYTTEAAELASASGHTAWFSWVAPISGDVYFDTASTPAPRWDSTLDVWQGETGLSHLVHVAFDDDGELQPGVTTIDGFGTSKVTFTAVAGTRYWIQVDSYDYPADVDNPSAGYPRTDCRLRWGYV